MKSSSNVAILVVSAAGIVTSCSGAGAGAGDDGAKGATVDGGGDGASLLDASDGATMDAAADGGPPASKNETRWVKALPALTLTPADGGDVLVAGYVAGDLDIDATHRISSANVTSPFVARLDKAGNAVWARAYVGGAGADDFATAIAWNGTDTVYIGGTANTPLSFPGASGSVIVNPAPAAVAASFVVALDEKTGVAKWGTTLRPPVPNKRVTVEHLAFRDGVLVVSGFHDDTFEYPTTDGTATTSAVPNGFVARIDTTTGAVAWLALTPSVRGLAVADDGDVVVAGRFDPFTPGGSMVLGGKTLTAPGGGGIGFVARLDPSSGGARWLTGHGGAGASVELNDVAVSTDDIVVAGSVIGDSDLGGVAVSPAGSTDAFFAHVTPTTGAMRPPRVYGGTDRDVAVSVALDRWGQIIAAGRTSSKALTIEGTAMPPQAAGVSSSFVVKRSTSDAATWTKFLYVTDGSNSSYVNIHRIDALSDGDIAGLAVVSGTAELGLPAPRTSPRIGEALLIRWTP